MAEVCDRCFEWTLFWFIGSPQIIKNTRVALSLLKYILFPIFNRFFSSQFYNQELRSVLNRTKINLRAVDSSSDFQLPVKASLRAHVCGLCFWVCCILLFAAKLQNKWRFSSVGWICKLKHFIPMRHETQTGSVWSNPACLNHHHHLPSASCSAPPVQIKRSKDVFEKWLRGQTQLLRTEAKGGS